MFDRLLIFGIGIVVASLAIPQLMPAMLTDLNGGSPGSVAGASDKSQAPSDALAAPGYSRQVALSADRGGNYVATATINNVSVTVIVDTGASMVALTAETASRIGVHPPPSDYVIAMETANGITTAAPVVINRIRIGSIDVYNVEAAVMRRGALLTDLLGMSFLNKLSKFQAGGGQLVLVQ